MNDIFADTDFELMTFTDIKMSEDFISSRYFIDCSFVGCDFTGTRFESCTFTGCKFTDCNLSLIKVPSCHIGHTSFLKCKMVGIDWTTASWKSNATKKRVPSTNTFTESMLDYSIFVGLNLTGVKILRCTAKDVYFEHANLQEGDFSGTDFNGAVIANCNLTRSDFSSATNYSINPVYNNVSKARFSFPDAMTLIHSLGVEIVE